MPSSVTPLPLRNVCRCGLPASARSAPSPVRRPGEVHVAQRLAAAQVRDPGVGDRRARQVEAFEPRQAPDLDEVGVGDVAHAAEIECGGVAALDGLPKRQRLRLRDGGDVRRAARQVGDGRAQRLPAVEAALARDERTARRPARSPRRRRARSAACRDRAGRSCACRPRRAGATCSGSAAPSPRACRSDRRRAGPPPCRRTARGWRRCGRDRARGHASGRSSRRSPVRGRERAARRAASVRRGRPAGCGAGVPGPRAHPRRARSASAWRPSSAMRGCGGRTDAA